MREIKMTKNDMIEEKSTPQKTKKERRLEYLQPSEMAYRDLCRTIRPTKTLTKLRDMSNKDKAKRKKDRDEATYATDTLNELRRDAVCWLTQKVSNIPVFRGQGDFDDWHNCLCRHLIEEYDKNEYKTYYESFSYGQAQKWVNMTLKNLYLLTDDIDRVYTHLHIPVDNIILTAVLAPEKRVKSLIEKAIKKNVLSQEDENYISDIFLHTSFTYSDESGKDVIYDIKSIEGMPWSRWDDKIYCEFQQVVRKEIKAKNGEYACPMDWEHIAWRRIREILFL
jgi:hypothetical protein